MRDAGWNANLILAAVLALNEVLIFLESDGSPDNSLVSVNRHSTLRIVERDLDKR